MILGIHGSVIFGLDAALQEAQALGVSALQILPYRRHHLPTSQDLERFKQKRAKSRIARLVVHSRFVPSLGSKDEARRRRSLELLTQELSIAAALGAEAYVLHAGAYSPDDDPGSARRRLAQAVQDAVWASAFQAPILLENVPGGGRRMGSSLEELADILEALSGVSVACGLCLDTAHAWAAGYDVASEEGVADFLSLAERLAGKSAVRLFHLNDTRAEQGSRLENHWHWGQGRLSPGRALAVLSERFGRAGVLGILETPKDAGADERNLAYLREFLG